MIKTNISVIINGIDVDQWYYSFDYDVAVNGKVVISKNYENDHSWSDDPEAFRRHLEEGGATLIVLEECLPPNLFEL